MNESSAKEEFQHILAWMPNWVGDVVFALPTVQALRRRYPLARITAIAKAPSHDFLSLHPDIDSVIQFPSNDSLKKQICFAFGLRKYHFDLAVLFPNSMRSAWLSLFSGASRRIGYETDGRNFLLTDPIPVVKDSRSVHGVDYYSGIIKPLGIEVIDPTFPVLVPKKTADISLQLLQQMGVQPKQCLIAVSPGASKPEKRWHTERFGILCQRLIKEQNAKILLLGSRGEKDLLEKVKRFCPSGDAFVLSGLNMQVVAGFLRNCKLLVANDSGLMNFAALLNTPVVGIFGPGHPKTTDPLICSDRKEIVSLNFECSPCRHKFFRDCKPSSHNKPFCLEDISVRLVAEAADSVLKKNP